MRETGLPVAIKRRELPEWDIDPLRHPDEVLWHFRALLNGNSGVIKLLEWNYGVKNQVLWIILERPDPCETLLNYRLYKCMNKTPEEIEFIAWKIFKQVTFESFIMFASLRLSKPLL